MDKHEWATDTIFTIEPSRSPFLPLDFKKMKKKEIVAHFEAKLKSRDEQHAVAATKAKTIESFLLQTLYSNWRDG